MPRDLVQLMHSFFTPVARMACATEWCPATDVYRTRRGWLVKVDAAGIQPQDIEVSVSGRRLTVAGFRKDVQVEEGQSHYQMEITYSSFQRTIELPCPLEWARIATDYRDGMLFVRVQTEERQP